MESSHAVSGTVIRLGGASPLTTEATRVLLECPTLRVIRLPLPRGKEIASHTAPGEITVHCLEGRVGFECHGTTRELGRGDLLYLAAAEPHALRARDDAVLLVTMSLPGTRGHSV